jgi:hypothetical protein
MLSCSRVVCSVCCSWPHLWVAQPAQCPSVQASAEPCAGAWQGVGSGNERCQLADRCRLCSVEKMAAGGQLTGAAMPAAARQAGAADCLGTHQVVGPGAWCLLVGTQPSGSLYSTQCHLQGGSSQGAHGVAAAAAQVRTAVVQSQLAPFRTPKALSCSSLNMPQ